MVANTSSYLRTVSTTKDYFVSDVVKENDILSLSYPTAVNRVIILLCVSGTMRIQINLAEYNVDRNTLLTIFPGSLCEIKKYDKDLGFKYLYFSPDFSLALNTPREIDFVEYVSKYPTLKLTDRQFDCLSEFHSFLLTQYQREKHPYEILLSQNLLASFMTEYVSLYYPLLHGDTAKGIESKNHDEELFWQLIKLLREHIKEERTVIFYANKMYLSPKYLSQRIKKVSGRSIMEWINNVTIIYIKSMLKTTNLTILQIADEMNFPNSSFLGSYFKKHTGITPLKYRKS